MANSSYGLPVTCSQTRDTWYRANVEYPRFVPGSKASVSVRGSPSCPSTSFRGPLFRAPVASGVIPEVVIQQLLNGDVRLARVTQRLRLRDEVKSSIVNGHLSGGQTLLTLLGGDCKNSRTDRLGNRSHATCVRFSAVAPFDFEHDPPVPNYDSRKVTIVALQQPVRQFGKLRRIHSSNAAHFVRIFKHRPPTLPLCTNSRAQTTATVWQSKLKIGMSAFFQEVKQAGLTMQLAVVILLSSWEVDPKLSFNE